MPKFTVPIREVNAYDIEVEAVDAEGALEKANALLEQGEFDNGDPLWGDSNGPEYSHTEDIRLDWIKEIPPK